MGEDVKKLYQEIDDGLYKLREAKANHYTQERFVTGLLDAALRRAKAEGIRDVADEMRESGNDKLQGWINWCVARAAQIEQGE